jgi:hypothetical protein
MSLASVEDKRSKEQVFLADTYRAAKYLNLQRNFGSYLWTKTHPSLQGVRAEDLYHTRETLRRTEVLKVADTSFQSPDGNDCYRDKKLWEAAQDLCRHKGRMLPIIMKKILEVVEEQFDTRGYPHHEEDGELAALCTIGRMYIDGINLCTMEVDNIRNELQIIYQRKPRTYEKVETLLEEPKFIENWRNFEKFSILLKKGEISQRTCNFPALEKGQGKALHEDEQSALKSLVNNHMRNENMKAFQNEAMLAATNEMMVQYSRILDTNPGRVSLESFQNEWLRMWSRIMSPSVAMSGISQQMEQLEQHEERHKAMAVSIDQAREEARAKAGGKGGPTSQGAEDMIMVRKELLDMKSQINQLKQETRNAQLKREQMEGCMGKFNGRSGYQGNGARNYNTGGWGRENKGMPYKQRGGHLQVAPCSIE